MNWNYQHLRLTAFFSSTINIKDNSWWTDTMGGDPENSSYRMSPIPTREEEGYIDELIIHLKIEPNRADWLLLSPSAQEIDEFPNLGDSSQAIAAFTELANNWFKNIIDLDIARLAFGSRLLRKVKDRIESYKELKKILPNIKIDPEKSSDFLYQINRPRLSSTIDGLYINRVSKWRCMNSKVLSLHLGSVPQSNIATDIYATNLDLDISTNADRETILPLDTLQGLLKEFINLGEEIAQKGDIE